MPTGRSSSRALALGRLLRLSLAPSAPADVLGGAVLAAGALPTRPGLWFAMLASSCVYHGGLALNDWVDREEDARARPERPIPSGVISARTALALGLGLLVAGPFVALVGAPEACPALVLAALAALLYDLWGRGPLRGPFLLGACRAANLAAGLTLGLAGASLPPALLLVALSYGLYVFGLSTLARLEDRPAVELQALRPAWRLQLGAGLLVVPGLLAAVLSARNGRPPELALLPLLPTGLGAVGLWRFASARGGRSWSGPELAQATGLGLRRLLLITCALALGAGPPGLLPALAILAGYPLARQLRGLFPPS